jgi:predicted transcriptional regulator
VKNLLIKGEMMNIGELCTRDTFIIQKDDNIVEAAKLMRVFNVGDLIVVSANEDGNTPIGIVTDRDIVMGVVADNADPQNVKVSEIMSKELVTGSEDDGVYESIERMRVHGIRRLPIVDKESLRRRHVGIFRRRGQCLDRPSLQRTALLNRQKWVKMTSIQSECNNSLNGSCKQNCPAVLQFPNA